jgi:hypothetical protein
MKSSKKALSVGRYFRARLKPFGRFAFWGPLSFIAVVSLLVWQYNQNPQWRDSNAEQPDGLENSSDRDIGAEMPLQSLEQEAQRQQRESGVDFQDAQNTTNNQTPLNNSSANNNSNNQTSTPTGSTLEQLTGTQRNNQQKDAKTESSSIFLPLMPGVDTNALPLTSNNTTSKNEPKNSTQSSDRSALVNGLIEPKPVTVTENPMQNAMNQQFGNNITSPTTATAPNTTNTTNTITNNNPQTNRGIESVTSSQVTGQTNSLPGQTTIPQPYSQSYPSPYRSVPTQVSPTQPSTLGQQQSSMPTYQNPYVNSPVQTNSVQQPVQSQSPYLNSPVTTNPTGVGNPVGTNQTQTTQSYPSPYLNTPVQTTSPVTPTQNVQPNYNNNVVNYPRSQGTDERLRVGY